MHSLVCQLDNSKIKFRTTRVSSKPNYNQIKEIFIHNINTLQIMLDYCRDNNILSYRMPSSIFPLWTHPTYENICDNIIDELLPLLQNINTHNIHISNHPDQFILLNSLTHDVNMRSVKELNKWGNISKYFPLKLLNIHVGGYKGTFDEHHNIFQNSFDLLCDETKAILSLENDEKNYCFTDVLKFAQSVGCMIVPDFHHERCFQLRNNGNKDIAESIIMDNIDNVLHTYVGKIANPTFHISSPKFGWTDRFKDNCMHADYIDINDYPHELSVYSDNVSICLDVEAKAKNNAIHALDKMLAY